MPECKNGGTCASNGTYSAFPVCECPSGFLGSDCSIKASWFTCQNNLIGYWPLVSNQVEDRSLIASREIYGIDIWNRNDVWMRHGSLQPAARYTSPFYPEGSALFEYSSEASTGLLRVDDPLWPQGSDLSQSFVIGAFVKLHSDTNPDLLQPFIAFDDAVSNSTNMIIFLNKRGKALLWYQSATNGTMELEVWAPNVIGTSTPLSFFVVQYNSTANELTAGTLEFDTGTYVVGNPVSLPFMPANFNTSAMRVGETKYGFSTLPVGSVNLLQGSIACLSIHNHSLPLNQTLDLINACWPILGGPEPPTAIQSCFNLCLNKPTIENAKLAAEYYSESSDGLDRFPELHTHLSRLVYVCEANYSYNGTAEVEQNVTCLDGHWHITFNECSGMTVFSV